MEQNLGRGADENIAETRKLTDVYEGRDPWEAYREAEAQRPEVIWPDWNDKMRGREWTG